MKTLKNLFSIGFVGTILHVVSHIMFPATILHEVVLVTGLAAYLIVKKYT
jgi:hypothetical protein